MQTQHYVIFAGIALGLALMGYYIYKAILRAFDRHYAAGVRDQKMQHGSRITALNADLSAMADLRNAEARKLAGLRVLLNAIKATPFTSSDYQELIDIAETLRIACETWKVFPGAEGFVAKATVMRHNLLLLADRMDRALDSASSMNDDTLDTQLIEWLNKRGDLHADLEQSIISFPHQADTEGYAHLRDAIREAYELDLKRQANELGLPATEAAA